jgi:hypothetical protein
MVEVCSSNVRRVRLTVCLRRRHLSPKPSLHFEHPSRHTAVLVLLCRRRPVLVGDTMACGCPGPVLSNHRRVLPLVFAPLFVSTFSLRFYCELRVLSCIPRRGPTASSFLVDIFTVQRGKRGGVVNTSVEQTIHNPIYHIKAGTRAVGVRQSVLGADEFVIDLSGRQTPVSLTEKTGELLDKLCQVSGCGRRAVEAWQT